MGTVAARRLERYHELNTHGGGGARGGRGGVATEAGGSEGINERVSADSDEELPVLQASDGEEDNERSARLFRYDPDNGDVWGEYQAVMGDPMFAW